MGGTQRRCRPTWGSIPASTRRNGQAATMRRQATSTAPRLLSDSRPTYTQAATDQEGSSGGGLRQPANSVRGEESHSRPSSCCVERHEFDHLGRLVVSRQADGARGTGGRSAGTTKQSGEHLTVSTVASCCTRPIRRARPSSFKLQPGCHASCEVIQRVAQSQGKLSPPELLPLI